MHYVCGSCFYVQLSPTSPRILQVLGSNRNTPGPADSYSWFLHLRGSYIYVQLEPALRGFYISVQLELARLQFTMSKSMH